MPTIISIIDPGPPYNVSFHFNRDWSYSLWSICECFWCLRALSRPQRKHLIKKNLRLSYKSTTVPGNKPSCSSKSKYMATTICALKKGLPALISIVLRYNKMITTVHPTDPMLKTCKILNWWSTWSLKVKVHCTSHTEYTSKSMVRKIVKTWHFWTGLLPLPFFSLAVLHLEECHANSIID